MDENRTIEEYKASELALKKQLEEANEKNRKLEEEMKYRDKMTGLWNRRYAERLLTNNEIGTDQPGFTIICVEIDNLNLINEQSGVDAGDAIFKSIAEGMQNSLGQESICCKMVGTKMCAFLKATEEELQAKKEVLEHFFESAQEANPELKIAYGLARHDTEPDKNGMALLKEAEYDLQMHIASNEDDENTPEVARKKHNQGEDITILMIDDSLVILRTLQTMLKDDYKVIMTTSGMEGYEMAKSKNPDLILLDYNMPVVDGERIMHLLKKSNRTKNIPVIFISGVSDKEKILKVATLKPAGYLLKPVEKDRLLEVVNTVLQS